jgi:hypothetical protein
MSDSEASVVSTPVVHHFDISLAAAAVERERERGKKRTVFGVGLGVLNGLYIIVGVGLVLYNKWMLTRYKFTFPITMILVRIY